MAKHLVRSPVAGSVFAHSTGVGQRVVEGTTLLIVELMKTEVSVATGVAGTVAWLAACGTTVEAETLVAIVDDATP